MGGLRTFIFVAAALLVINYVSASIGQHHNCPPRNKVHNNKLPCQTDADCRNYGMVCCSNQFNKQFCVQRAPFNKFDDHRNHKPSGGGSGVPCGRFKCRSNEKCKQDRVTKRLRCQGH
ncbi:hypothetical protein PYW07_009548 [Mythimna separata]|uniref:Uncharacterized protein n=1 Tax=Mythimna separata TaxID=271217 RepID=A0AAD8DNE8_MYTSE|nr:hypothetical protein PYW07_009548 [Mythimna separata]